MAVSRAPWGLATQNGRWEDTQGNGESYMGAGVRANLGAKGG
jgi:hypothetical protein